MLALAEQPLATYRLFWINGAGRITAAADLIEAMSDDDAIRQARDLAKGRAVEIWCGARRVATLSDGGRGQGGTP